MSNTKTLSLKWALAIVVGVLVTISLTSGIILAAFSYTASLTPCINVAKMEVQLWSNSGATSAITGAVFGGSVYITTTQNNVATAVPSVMRASFTGKITPTANWIPQSNGWYYYTGIVGGGYKGDYGVKSNAAIKFGDVGSLGNVVVELMQYTNDAGGFIKLWSATNRGDSIILNDSYTIDGKTLLPIRTDNNSIQTTKSPFAVFSGENPKAPIKNSSENEDNKGELQGLSFEVTADKSVTDKSVTESTYLNGGNLHIYNNSYTEMIFMVDTTAEIKGLTSIDTTVGLKANFAKGWATTNHTDTFTGVTSVDIYNKTISNLGSDKNEIVTKFVYTKPVKPGEYVEFLANNSFIVNYNNPSFDAKETLTVSIKNAISVLDADTFVNQNYPTSYPGVFENTTTLAPYTQWVNAMKSYFGLHSINLSTLDSFPL